MACKSQAGFEPGSKQLFSYMNLLDKCLRPLGRHSRIPTNKVNFNGKHEWHVYIFTVSLNCCQFRVITGFALDDLNGMGITADPGLLDISQPFYVQVDLPHSVKQGETLAVEMVKLFSKLRSKNMVELAWRHFHMPPECLRLMYVCYSSVKYKVLNPSKIIKSAPK